MKNEKLNALDKNSATVIRGSRHNEYAHARGKFHAACFGPDGRLKWSDIFENTVVTEGKNLALNTYLAGAAYTVTGPYMGLISSVGYAAIAAADTAAQINGTNGWKEAGSGANFPLYTTPRKTCAWSAAAAGAKALSVALDFPIVTTGGTVKGCFIIFGTGAVSTIADTNGVLYSAGLFTGGDKVVAPGDTLSVTYSTSI
jgi:hypothetical protein